MYRRDRLFTSDKERVNCLQECLKNVRITDEASYFNNMKTVVPEKVIPVAPVTGTSPMAKTGTINKHDKGGGGGPSGGAAGGGGAGGNFTSAAKP